MEAARQRRYLLRWVDKFRHGKYGPGGNLDHVADGVAELRAIQVPLERLYAALGKPEKLVSQPTLGAAGTATTSPGNKWILVNLPPGQTELQSESIPTKKYIDIKLRRGNKIQGPYIKYLPGANGTAATISAQEGMWEIKTGRKIDGGERRRAEVRAKQRIAESKK